MTSRAAAPFFSIVIPCRNAAPTLASTLESVIAQSEPSRELIVIDAASTDQTPALLERYRSKLAFFLSEPDSGVYAGMNKALPETRGEWLLFLGANDRLASNDVLSRVRKSIESHSADVFCGEAAYSDGRIWGAPASPSIRYRNFMHHQASFYRRALFERFRFDESLRMQADYDLNLRLWLAGSRPIAIQHRIAECASGGLSDSGRWINYREEIAVRHRHFPRLQCLPWDLASIARFLRKTIRRNRVSPQH